MEGVDFSTFSSDEEVSDWLIAHELTKGGYWLDGDDYQELRAAMQLLEKLTGRAHVRAIRR